VNLLPFRNAISLQQVCTTDKYRTDEGSQHGKRDHGLVIQEFSKVGERRKH